MCIFCKIANKEIASEFVFENEDAFVIKDINPKAPTHLLVIPKKHIENLNDLNDEKIATQLFLALKGATELLGIKDYRTVINTGKGAGQDVFHLHIHILSGRQMVWPPG